MVFLRVVGRRRGRNAFCAHSMNAANLRAAHVNSARNPRNPKALRAPLGESALHLCTRGSLTASWPVYGMWMARQGKRKEKKKKRIWLAVRQQGQLQMLLFTLFSHSEEQRRRLPTTLSGTQCLPCSLAQPICRLEQTGYHFTDTEHLCSDEGSASSLCVEAGGGRPAGPPLVTALKPPLGTSAGSPPLAQPGQHQAQTRLKASALIPHLNCRCAERALLWSCTTYPLSGLHIVPCETQGAG